MIHHIVSGSFRSSSLFLLAFTPPSTITHVSTIPTNGPHQYIARSPQRDRIYTTSWAQPPTLAAWGLGFHYDQLRPINTVDITATSSYISLPPPYTNIYSAGGPTGEVHALDPETGGFGIKVQEVLFVPQDELEKADKTRAALRYGSHAIEISPQGLAFIPVLGTNSIEMYALSPEKHLNHIASVQSPRPHDGPRHLVVHPSGTRLYVVSEHTNFLDLYAINRGDDNTPPSLTHRSSISLLPPHLSSSSSKFRGDTLALHPPTPLHPSPIHIFTTTRGSTPDDRGWLSVFQLDIQGDLIASPSEEESPRTVTRWETPTSGGKANAIDLLLKSNGQEAQMRSEQEPFKAKEEDSDPSPLDEGEGLWILLTDDCGGKPDGEESCGPGVRILEWDEKHGLKGIVAEWGDDEMRGGSHAVWLD